MKDFSCLFCTSGSYPPLMAVLALLFGRLEILGMAPYRVLHLLCPDLFLRRSSPFRFRGRFRIAPENGDQTP